MSLKNYKPKTKKALWTGTPSGKRLLASAAARKQKSADRRKVGSSSKSFTVRPEQRPLAWWWCANNMTAKDFKRLTKKHGDPRRQYPGDAVFRKPIRRETPAHAKARRIYNSRVKVWLTERGNQFCKCCFPRYCTFGVEITPGRFEIPMGVQSAPATECHHKHGHGHHNELLMVEELWIPVCHNCHDWIHYREPDEARAIHMLAPHGEWNRLPEGVWRELTGHILPDGRPETKLMVRFAGKDMEYKMP